MSWFMFAQLSQETQLSVTAAAMTTMGGALATMFLYYSKANANTLDKFEKLATEFKSDLKECRDDREVLHAKFHELATQVAQVKRDQ